MRDREQGSRKARKARQREADRNETRRERKAPRAVAAAVRVGKTCDHPIRGYTQVYIGRTRARRELGNPYAIRGEREGGSAAGTGHSLQHHKRAVELHTEWLQTGRLRNDAGPGISVTTQRGAQRGELSCRSARQRWRP